MFFFSFLFFSVLLGGQKFQLYQTERLAAWQIWKRCEYNATTFFNNTLSVGGEEILTIPE